MPAVACALSVFVVHHAVNKDGTAMSSEALEAEMQARFDADRKAYEGLGAREQKIASYIAAGTFGARQGIVSVGALFVDAAETAFNIVIRTPAVWAWGKISKGAGETAKMPLRATAATARGALSLASRAWLVAGQGVVALNRLGLVSDTKREDMLATVAQRQWRIAEQREKISAWAKAREQKSQRDWKLKQLRITKALKRAGEFLEYHGAIGLYRGFKYLLDPRKRDGSPLLGNEKLSKAVGFVAALVLFGFLTYQLSKIGVVAKIMHYKLAHSMIHSTAPLWLKLAQQTVLQPAITVGLTALKFVTLPVIAAARGRMTSTEFTQGIAYRYNQMLQDYRENKMKRDFERQEKYTTHPDDPKWKEFRNKAVIAARKKSLSFLRSFFHHIVEKSSPAFYEVRFRHYKEIREGRRHARAEKKAERAAARIQPTPLSPGFAPDAPKLAEKFDAAQNPAPDIKPPTPKPPVPKPPVPPAPNP